MICLTACVLLASQCSALAEGPGAKPLVESYLLSGELAAGEMALKKHLDAAPQDSQARFGLGTLQFLRGVERLMQSLHRYGLKENRSLGFPILRLPAPENPRPQKITYVATREIVQFFLDDLKQAEATLSQVKDPDVKLPLHFGRVRLDFDSDGLATEEETLWRIYKRISRDRRTTPEAAEQFIVILDAGDVHWLRGYCHLLMAGCEMQLAYDTREVFERTAHLFFANPETPYPFLVNGRKEFSFSGDFEIVDFIALIHLINFPLAEPKRMKKAHEHILTVVAQSRASWKAILAETDNDHEWVPNPKQQGAIPNVRVTKEMVTSWHEFLDEFEALLQGKKLVPFWREHNGRGVNLKRFFTKPKPFDLVLWVQGTAAQPYLEKGRLTDPNFWQRLNRAFSGQFMNFAAWFN
jgi:hypothetical protein